MRANAEWDLDRFYSRPSSLSTNELICIRRDLMTYPRSHDQLRTQWSKAPNSLTPVTSTNCKINVLKDTPESQQSPSSLEEEEEKPPSPPSHIFTWFSLEASIGQVWQQKIEAQLRASKGHQPCGLQQLPPAFLLSAYGKHIIWLTITLLKKEHLISPMYEDIMHELGKIIALYCAPVMWKPPGDPCKRIKDQFLEVGTSCGDTQQDRKTWMILQSFT